MGWGGVGLECGEVGMGWDGVGFGWGGVGCIAPHRTEPPRTYHILQATAMLVATLAVAVQAATG